MTPSGHVLRIALKSQGGWTAWKDLPPLRSRRETSCGEHVAEAQLAALREISGRLPLVPFEFVDHGLVDDGLVARYLGVESEVRGGQVFDKIRFSSREDRWPYPLVAYFERPSRRLSRLLLATPGRESRLVVFSRWSKLASTGVLVPRQIRWHFLERPTAHADLDHPDCEERLVDIVLDDSPAGGENPKGD